MNLADLYIAKKLAGGGGGGTGTDNYNDLSNKPQINGTTLTGDKSAADLELQPTIDSENPISADYVDDSASTNKFVTSSDKLTWGGKQDKIDADHKLSSDLVDDTGHTNLFVTPTEKSTWSGKQNAIDSSHKLSSDLVDDTNHTNKFVTSAEKNTWNAKQNAIDSDHKLSSSLVSFSTAEAAALASGIDSDDVNQIGVNQTNILYGLQNGVKNLLNFAGWSKGIGVYNGTKSYTDTTFTLTPTAAGATTLYESTYFKDEWRIPVTAGEKYVFSWNTTAASNFAYAQLAPNGQVTSGSEVGILTKKIEYTVPSGVTWLAWRFGIYSSTSTALTVSELMVCTQDSWDQEPNVYRPYALPNYDLTRLEAEDRAALAEEIDAGAKNIFNYSGQVVGTDLTSFTNNGDGSFTAKNSTQLTAISISYVTVNLTANTRYVLSGCPSGGDAINTYSMDIRTTTGTWVAGSDTGNGKEFSVSSSGTYRICFRFGNGYTFPSAGITFKPMICTKAAFCVSNKFVPYCKSNSDLTGDMSLVRPMNPYGQSVVSSGSLDNINKTETRVYNNPSGLPAGTSGYVICETTTIDGQSATQTITFITGQSTTIFGQSYPKFFRSKVSGTWRDWMLVDTNGRYSLIKSTSPTTSATVDISSISDGTYLLRCSCSSSATTRYGVSLYTLLLNSTGTTMVFNPIVEVTNAKISNLTRTDNTLNFTFDYNGFHSVALTAI